ncbi:hypothetical protein KAR91_21245 [Candidatus Pacearchaeota archaeon]|nr:hypothetical protein [Candidatus Pacearchaeota archaeon]
MNALREWLNNNVPNLIVLSGKARLIENSTRLSKADRAIIDPILATAPEHTRVYIRVNQYSIMLSADTWFMVSEHSCQYADNNVYLWDMNGDKAYSFDPIPLTTVEETKADIAAYHEAVELARKAIDVADNAAIKIRHFAK